MTAESGAPCERLVLACGGGTNVGQLANEAAFRLALQGRFSFGSLAAIAAGNAGAIEQARTAAERIVIDGCEEHCARRVAECVGLLVDRHVVVTELGIAKTADLALYEEDVAAVLVAAG
jgi:uncharacterized metal-binding protein